MSGTVRIQAAGRGFDIEYAFVGATETNAPWLVILHEGLGSLAMWRDFPARLCAACNVRGLVYSRPGYGRSTPRAAGEHWAPDFMEREASAVLPALLDALSAPPRHSLFGHSDGASIALIHAATCPQRVAKVVVEAPHIMVEDVSIASIAAARTTYLETDLRQRLARYHADVDSAFWGWNDIWLDPAFRDWSIRSVLPRIECPILAIQGRQDQYGTMAQIDGIAAALPPGQCQLLKLDPCSHSPHRDQPEAVMAATARFLHGTE
ncbi:MAG: alpha/beta fold hydrolase [Rhodanobacteraceae bacterium]